MWVREFYESAKQRSVNENREYSMLILASASEIRAQMLRDVGLSFLALPSPYDEEAAKPQFAALPYPEFALALANGKAHAVSDLYPEAYVIGADQLCADDTQIYDKPLTEARAKQHLRKLSGTSHWQHSAACLYHAGKKLWETCEIVTLTMHRLSDKEIDNYITKDSPLNACGAYCYEKTGHRLFSHIEGSVAAIKGLPLDALLAALKTHCKELL
jgi:septum formation protein